MGPPGCLRRHLRPAAAAAAAAAAATGVLLCFCCCCCFFIFLCARSSTSPAWCCCPSAPTADCCCCCCCCCVGASSHCAGNGDSLLEGETADDYCSCCCWCGTACCYAAGMSCECFFKRGKYSDEEIAFANPHERRLVLTIVASPVGWVSPRYTIGAPGAEGLSCFAGVRQQMRMTAHHRHDTCGRAVDHERLRDVLEHRVQNKLGGGDAKRLRVRGRRCGASGMPAGGPSVTPLLMWEATAKQHQVSTPGSPECRSIAARMRVGAPASINSVEAKVQILISSAEGRAAEAAVGARPGAGPSQQGLPRLRLRRSASLWPRGRDAHVCLCRASQAHAAARASPKGLTELR
jgi:hypothetical protein